MNRLFKGFAVVALVGLVAAPQAEAQTLMTPGTSYSVTFSADGSGGATTTSSFLLPGLTWYDISYTDCCIAGDQYELFADGSSLGLTAVSPPFQTVFTRAAYGGQVITLEMPVFGGGLPAGSTISIDHAVVPEPGTVILMATGLLGLGVAMRRRREDELED